MEKEIERLNTQANPSLDSYTGGGIEWYSSEEYTQMCDEINKLEDELKRHRLFIADMFFKFSKGKITIKNLT